VNDAARILDSALAQPLGEDIMISRYFEDIDERNLTEQVQACLNEYRDSIRRQVIEEGRIDILITEVLGYSLMDFHEDMLMAQDNPIKVGEYNWAMILGYRGSGKSTVSTVARAIFEILRNPNIRILIASNTGLQAEVFLREIKAHFEQNQKFIDIFGSWVGDKWDSKEIVVKTRTAVLRESTVTCIGVFGATASRHYDLILGDDLVDEENSRTPGQREKLRIWFYKSLLPTLIHGGRIMLAGTLWNPSDLNNYIMKNTPGLVACIVKALDEKWPGGTPWPEQAGVDHFLALRKTMGVPEFESQFQMNTSAMEGKIFSYEMFHWYDKLPEGVELRKYQGVDLAISQSTVADFFAHATIGVDPASNKKYVLDVFGLKAQFGKQTDTIRHHYYLHDPIVTAIEANAYQAAQIHQIKALDPELRVLPVFTMKDKVTRAMKLAARCNAAEVLFRKDQVELIQQLLEMPDGNNDDLFDALDIAVTAATTGIRKKRDKEFGLIGGGRP
jgi:phage terminase large subunit-like protein